MSSVRKVVCAISGGVDSSVAALLLKRQGFAVQGVFMKNWDVTDETGLCSVDQDREDAQFVCDHLDIPFREVNFVKEYWNEVFSQMVEGYEHGWTPNPDVLCNRHVKFGALFRYVTEQLGADVLATGHYVRSSSGQFLQHYDSEKGAYLLSGVDPVKDQTLFLAQISQRALRRSMFPVGGMMKSKVKAIALEAGFERIVKKKESMGICFIGTRNFRQFIEEYIAPQPGNFVDVESGKVVGEHQGTHYWTVGQRTHMGGLSVAYFVQRVDPKTQTIWVAPGTNHPSLFTESFIASSPHWIHSAPANFDSAQTLTCQFKFQHIHPVIECDISRVDDTSGYLKVTLSRPLRAITPGQYAVFYDGEVCLGSAQILEPGPSLFHNKEHKSPVENVTAFT